MQTFENCATAIGSSVSLLETDWLISHADYDDGGGELQIYRRGQRIYE